MLPCTIQSGVVERQPHGLLDHLRLIDFFPMAGVSGLPYAYDANIPILLSLCHGMHPLRLFKNGNRMMLTDCPRCSMGKSLLRSLNLAFSRFAS